MDLTHHMPCLCWELLFSILRMLCMDKWIFLNFYLMISGNYVVIMILIILIYVYMYACISLSDRVISNHDYLMLIFICIDACMHVII